jgi:diguanylate cyclase
LAFGGDGAAVAQGTKEYANLPARVGVLGPLDLLAFRVHMIIVRGRCQEALQAADDYEPLVRAAGDEMTLSFLDQGRMYALHAMGRCREALAAGLEALRRRHELGWVIGEAKTLADVAELHFQLGDPGQAMYALVRATALIDQCRPTDFRYLSAIDSLLGTAKSMELYELAGALLERLLATVRRDGVPLARALLLPQHVELADTVLRASVDLQLEWGLRLEQLGRTEEAAARFQRCVGVARLYLAATKGYESDLTGAVDAPLALARAKFGEADEAIALARDLVMELRNRQRYLEALVAHLAYGIALRARGDLAGARRELIAAEQLCGYDVSPTWRLTVQHELVLLTIAELPADAAGTLLTAFRAQANRLWELRLRGVSMLREVRRRQELESERATAAAAILHDELTGVGNRRQFEQLLTAIDGNGGRDRDNQTLVLLLLDIDHFKKINDRYSHSVGDQVLVEFGAILRANCRPHDVPVRFGGDEFALFLHTELPPALEIAERIRWAVLHRDWNRLAPGLKVTVSAGVAAYEPTSSAHQLFDVADRRLYEAKRRGRNRIAV